MPPSYTFCLTGGRIKEVIGLVGANLPSEIVRPCQMSATERIDAVASKCQLESMMSPYAGGLRTEEDKK